MVAKTGARLVMLASREFERSCLPGGAIHGKLAEIKRLADLIEQKRADLIERVAPFEFFCNWFVDVRDRLAYPLPAKPLPVAVAQFPGFVFAGAGAARNDGASDCAAR